MTFRFLRFTNQLFSVQSELFSRCLTIYFFPLNFGVYLPFC